MGQAIATALSSLLPAVPLLPSSAADTYATDSTSQQLLTNPLMTGTSGTVSGVGASGTNANGWNGGTDTGTVTSVFLAGQSRTDGIGFNQRITISAAGSGAIVNLRQTGLSSRVSIGDTIYAVGSLKLSGMTDVAFVVPSLEVTIDGVSSNIRVMDSSASAYDQTDVSFDFRTADFLLSGTSITALNFFLRVGFGTSGTGAAVVEAGRMGVFKY